MKVMTIEGKFINQAFAYAGFVGKVEGLFNFVKEHPDYYSAAELAQKVEEIRIEMYEKLEADERRQREREQQLEEFHSHLGRI